MKNREKLHENIDKKSPPTYFFSYYFWPEKIYILSEFLVKIFLKLEKSRFCWNSLLRILFFSEFS